MTNKLTYILALAVLIGCTPKLDKDLSFSSGNADFSKTLYVGDNLLSGYTNDGLYADGQETSIAQLLSTQFQVVGGDAVAQPTISGTSGSGHLQMDAYTSGVITMSTLEADAKSGETSMIFYDCSADSVLPLYSSYSGTISNYAVPGLKVADIMTPGLATANTNYYNPFLERISSSDGSYYDIINAQSPTFFVVAFGLSDVLSYSKNGASCGNTTDKDLFRTNYDTLVSMLMSKVGSGVLCEIPSLDELPFLNANYSSEQDIYIKAKKIINPGNETRLFTAEDQFLRSKLDIIGVDGYGLSDSLPIKDEDVIDLLEKQDIAADIDNYNQIINEAGEKYGIPVVSMENYLLAQKGTFQGDSIILNGTRTRVNFAAGSAVSLDGYSPTPRGAAAIANQFIIAINEYYEAQVPMIDINTYKGLKIP